MAAAAPTAAGGSGGGSSSSSMASSPASLVLNASERTAFGYLFSLACPPESGSILTADSAVAFFGKSGLPATTLGTIWALADDKNNGFLDAKGFSLACRLIGHAQAGAPVDYRAAATPGPLPTLEGIAIPGLPAGVAAAAATAEAAPVTIQPADRSRYTRIFANAGPVNGLLDSDKAKDVFIKSNLPVDKLAAVWSLADTQQRGALDLSDFIIAMYFIQNTMNGTITTIPATLPPGLYESASVGAPKPVGAQPGSPLKAIRQQSTGGSFSTPAGIGPIRHQTTGSGNIGPFAGGPAPSAIPRQLTGQFQSPAQGSRVGSPAPSGGVVRSPTTAGLPAGSAFAMPPAVAPGVPTAASVIAAGAAVSPPWAVPAATIQRSAAFFSQLDTSNSGLLPGASVVPFFMQSQLPEATLAQVWDLADVHQRGSLGLEEFALAMHLIGESMAGKPLPTLAPGQGLPRELVPPSARGADLPAPVTQNESETQKDLFSLMDDDDDATSGALKAAAALPPALKNATASTFVNPTGSPPPPAPATLRQGSAPAPASFGAFDDDFFNEPMPSSAPPGGASAGTGSAVKSVRIADKPPSIIASPDTVTSFLPPASPQPGATGSQSGSQSLAAVQHESLRKDIDKETARQANLSAEATALESSIATDAASLSELEARLKTARAASDAEQARVAGLRERAATQSGELASLRAELISAESNLSALKVERDEVEQALMKEREEVREVRKRMEEVRVATDALKAEVEKAKKELRKEKGLGAITRKQLSSASAEKDKVETELEAVRRGELGDDVEGAGMAASEAFEPPAERAAALSPTDSVRSNNPFDRLNVGGTPTRGETVHSPLGGAAGTAASLGVAAGAGAALAGAASAAHAAVDAQGGDHQPAQSAEAASESAATEAPKQDDETITGATATQTAFDDAFGDHGATDADADTAAAASSARTAPPATDAFSSAFDDDFGAKDGPAAAAVSSEAPQGPTHGQAASNTAFDDAFSGFDDAAPAAATAQADHSAGEAQDDATAAVPTIAEPDDEPAARAVSDSRPSQNDEDDDSSDEDEEGPEDLDAPGGAGGGAGRRSGDARSSPFETDEPEPDASDAAGTASPQGESAARTTVGTSSNAEAATPTAPTMLGGLDPPPGRLTAQTTGSDTFHDAISATPASRAQSPGAAVPAVAATATTAAEEAEEGKELDAPASKPVRRAPPPAPSKGVATATSTSAAPTTAASSTTQANNAFDDFESAFEDLGPAVAAGGGASGSTPGTAGGAAAGTMSASTTTDFDDAFDNDFDFVPSFSGSGTSSAIVGTASATAGGPSGAAGTGATSSAAHAAFDDAFGFSSAAPSASGTTVPSSTSTSTAGPAAAAGTSSAPLTDFNSAFADFDASFSSPKAAHSALGGGGVFPSGAGGSGGSGSATGTNVSAPSSGFSFEDAFEPAGESVLSPPSVSGAGPTSTTTTTVVHRNPAPAPALPPRSNTTNTNPSSSLAPPPPASASTGQAEPLPSPALPDDAAPVQQLCAMGFSRAKVIDALEKSNYRVEKALQRLLASS